MLGDTDNILLQKIAASMCALATGGGGIFITSVNGSGTNLTLLGTTIFGGCVGSSISFCPDNTWGVGVVGALPKNVDVGTAYKYQGLDIATAMVLLSNYFFGGAGNFTMTGDENTALGFQSLAVNTTGNNNSTVGFQALFSNTTGRRNAVNGHSSLISNTSGQENVAIGYQTLFSNTTGSFNTGIGAKALFSVTTGGINTGFGNNVLADLTSGSTNTGLGFNTGRGIITGSNNTILGANVTGLAAALSNNIILADGAGNQRINVDSAGAVTVAQSLRVNGVLNIPTGANTRAGNAVLVAGTVTVANTSVTANTIVMLTRKTIGGVVGNTSYTVAAGASFTINSSVGTDTSTMSYFLIENP